MPSELQDPSSKDDTTPDPFHGFMRKPRCPCQNCQKPNCGKCLNCLGKVKFGGDGRNRRRCAERQCVGVGHNLAKKQPHVPKPVARPPRSVGSPEEPMKQQASPSSQRRRVKRRRCGTCPGCLAPECGTCLPCRDHPKFGGEGKTHACCLNRQCRALFPHITANGNTRVRDLGDKRMQSVDESAPPAKRARRPPPGNGPPKPARRVRCGKCPPCRRPPCEECPQCQEKQRIGRASKKVCDFKRCRVLYPPGSQDASDNRNTMAPRARMARSGSMKHGESVATVAAPIPKCPLPTVDEYFNLERTQGMKKKDEQDTQEEKEPVAVAFCGLECPLAPAENTCAGCQGARDDELEGQEIVLCDGPGCNREYHMLCAHPPLLEIPKHDWLCEDCSPEGSTPNLVKYLENADERKAEFLAERTGSQHPIARQAAFIDFLLWSDAQLSKREGTLASELDRSALTLATAITPEQAILGRTRGVNEEGSLKPVDMIGLPVRIYCNVDCLYHMGRIIDKRRIAGDWGEEEQAGETIATTELLIRFTAGKDGRKKPYQHWIILEEHAVAVGCAAIWAQTGLAKWEPSMLWIRSAREVRSVQDQVRLSAGDARFRSSDEKNDTDEFGHPVKTTQRVFGFIRTFGEDVYRFLNVRTHATCLDDKWMLGHYLPDEKVNLQYQSGKAELAEQEKVRNWYRLQQIDPLGPTALSNLDEYTLPAIEVSTNPPFLAAPCPSLLRGLDRAKIMKQLELRAGVKPSKDAAASVVSSSLLGLLEMK